MEITAKLSQLRMSPRKVNLVASLVRGANANDALTILEHTPKRAAKPLAKLIESAIANAKHNDKTIGDNLTVSKIEVGYGPSMKRFRPISHGRAHPYKRRTANVIIKLQNQSEAVKKAAKDKPATPSKDAVKAQPSAKKRSK